MSKFISPPARLAVDKRDDTIVANKLFPSTPLHAEALQSCQSCASAAAVAREKGRSTFSPAFPLRRGRVKTITREIASMVSIILKMYAVPVCRVQTAPKLCIGAKACPLVF